MMRGYLRIVVSSQAKGLKEPNPEVALPHDWNARYLEQPIKDHVVCEQFCQPKIKG